MTEPKKSTKPSKKTLTDFRAAHDKNFLVPEKIKAGLAKLGKDSWEYEVDFIRICGLSTTDFAMFRDQFEDFFVPVSVGGRNTKRIWGGSKALIDKMKELV